MKDSVTKVAAIGMGYVGLPLAVAMQKKFFVVGFDIDQERVNLLSRSIDTTKEVSKKELVAAKNLHFSSNENDLDECNIYVVTVPTPLDIFNRPDLGPLTSATNLIAKYIKHGDIVIYESTLYPGATEEECIPILESRSGLKLNKDFHVGYSPERINPGDKTKKVSDIIKITSGSNPKCSELIAEFYSQFINAGIHIAPSIKVAEAAKVVENIQRDVNIALINELATLFDELDIDTIEVINAAQSKWNFHSYFPGLVGGHCIGIDPYYLAHKAETVGVYPDLIRSARKINDSMADFVVQKFLSLLVAAKLDMRDAKVAVLGITFKENCPDIRNSKIIEVIKLLIRHGLKVDIIDPVASKKDVLEQTGLKLVDSLSNGYHGMIVAVRHDQFLELKPVFLKQKIIKNGILFDLKAIFNKTESSFRL